MYLADAFRCRIEHGVHNESPFGSIVHSVMLTVRQVSLISRQMGCGWEQGLCDERYETGCGRHFTGKEQEAALKGNASGNFVYQIDLPGSPKQVRLRHNLMCLFSPRWGLKTFMSSGSLVD